MRSRFWAAPLLVLTVFAAPIFGQEESTDPSARVQKKARFETTGTSFDVSKSDRPTVSTTQPSAKAGDAPPTSVSLPQRSRFKAFLNDTFGPDTLLVEAAGAGITTGRNAPKEWGGKSDGFARRFASNFGKNFIKQSVTYGVDEVLKVDSTFYRSRDRGIAARFRNSVFSAVTARNRNGKRVIGISKIAGSLAGNVAAAELWYPSRYNYVHGLKGAGITLAFDAAHYLIREFVWKK